MNSKADELDKQIAGALCQMLDCLEFKGNYFGELGLEQVKHWIKSRAASHIAARKVALVESKAFKNYWN